MHLQAAEEKLQKAESKHDIEPSTVIEANRVKSSDNALPIDMEVDDVPQLIDTTIPDTATAIKIADVIICMLDARDPISYQSTFIEYEAKSKPLLYILNKIGNYTTLFEDMGSFY